MTVPPSKEYDKGENGKDASASDSEGMSLTQLKVQMDEWQEDVFRIEARAIDRWGLAGGIVFRQVYHYSFKTDDPEGWVFVGYDVWRKLHGLSRKNIMTGISKLEADGVIETKHGVGNRLYVRLLPAAVIEALYPEPPALSKGSTQGSDVPKRDNRNPETVQQKYRNGISHIREVKEIIEESGAPRSSHIQKDVTEEHLENGERSVPAERNVEKYSEETRRRAIEVLNKLEARLEEEECPDLLPAQRKRYAKEAAQIMESLPPDLLLDNQQRRMWSEIIDHVVERWRLGKYKAMSFSTAQDDLLTAAEDVRPRRLQTYNPQTGRMEEMPEGMRVNRETGELEPDPRYPWELIVLKHRRAT